MAGRDRTRRGLLAGACLAAAAGGFGLAHLPLLEAPGWELAMVAALVAALLGVPAGLSSVRRELRRPRPSAPRAFAGAAAVLVLLQASLLAGAAARTLLFTPCSATAGLAFLPAVALPSALLAAALGTLAAALASGRAPAATLAYAGMALAFLAGSLWEAWSGPAAYVLDHLLGLWPGPIYDEALSVDRRLVLFRAGTLAWTVALVAAAALALARRDPSRRRGPAWAALALALAAVAAIRVAGARTGDLATRASLDAALGGRRTGPRCDLHFPREKPALAVERLLRDCELDVAGVARALSIDAPPRVTVWLHRSEAEKQRLVGAGRTDFTKPWLAEVQVLDAPGGPASLRHELVHAVAGALARPPLRVPARLGLWVNMGLVEGVAVALEPPRGDWTAHEWARAMRELSLLPSAEALVAPAGFFAAPPARAYAASGSLVRFLLERRGPGPLGRAYAGEPMAAAYGVPLPVLEAEWHAFLDGVPVPPALRAAAEARFRPAGLLGRRCAREVAGIERRAADAQRAGRPTEASDLWRAAARLTGDPEDLRRAGEALRATSPAAADRAFAEALAAAPAGRPALRSALLESRGDLAWRRGDRAGAARLWSEALQLSPDRPVARGLQARLALEGDPALAEAAAPWLLGAADPQEARRRLRASSAPLAAYLAGRDALARGEPDGAALLERALAGPLPGSDFRVEALRLLAADRCERGDGAAAAAAWEEMARVAARAADVERARDGARRCAEELARFGPLRPPAPPARGN